ncbi:MAG: sulfatase [bacterium]
MKVLNPICLSLLAASLAVLCGCREGTGARKPNVVIITIDALRPDHLSCYGYGRTTSPFIDSLAAKGTVFSNCHAVACWTAPSLASMFTSRHPRSHGVLHGFAQAREIHGQELLAPSFVTLAEALKANGYSTFGIAGTGHVTEQSGLAQGFDKFTGLWFPPCETIHDTALAYKKDLNSGKPFFLWVHYFPPHAPYYARKPWIEQYARHPSLVPEFKRQSVEWLQSQLPRIKENKEIQETIIDLYDAEINFVDAFVERLFKEVLPQGNTIVIVTADHGEMFFEHGSMGHAQSLFEEEVRIPLIIVPPAPGGFKAVTVSSPVCNIDFYPTILDLAEIPYQAGVQGESLKPLLTGGQSRQERPLFAEFDRGALPLRSVLENGWKLIVSPDKSETGMLFDLKSDPGETNNLFSVKPDVAVRLGSVLQQWMSANKPFDAPTGTIHLTPDQQKVLKSLGYVK